MDETGDRSEHQEEPEIKRPVPVAERPKLVMPDGQEIELEDDSFVRKKEREQEDRTYLPVIIKRTDETLRHPDDALDKAIEDGLEQLKRPPLSLLLSAVAGGLVVGFSALAVSIITTLALELQVSNLQTRLMTAFVYPLGFLFCILGGAQLFTEHTATALYPILDGRERIPKLLRLWGVVIVGNLAGAAGSAVLFYLAADVVHADPGHIAVGEHLVGYDGQALLVSAVIAGWLMALAAWLVVVAPRTISQIYVVYLVTFTIGLGGFHHSIAGSVEMFNAMLASDQFSAVEAAQFIGTALFGNLIGGSFFVALLNYAHIRKTYEL